MRIRPFTKQDWTSVSEIYANGIATGIATFETEVPSYDNWDQKFVETCRLVVEKNSEVIGFALLSRVSRREVYIGVVEVTLYVAENFRGMGVGEKLLRSLVEASEEHGFWTLQAGIFSENKASLRLHQKCGFRIVGIRKKIGQRKGKWHDNYLLERRSKFVMNN